jgi:hypothetical protein
LSGDSLAARVPWNKPLAAPGNRPVRREFSPKNARPFASDLMK